MAPTSTVVTPITTMTDTAALQSARLLQLCSANLPVGGFSFSQGLEQAVERGWIDSAEALHDWLRVFLQTSVSHTDLPLLGAQYDAVSSGCSKTFEEQDAWVAATRESAEILLAEQAMGKALKRLLNNLSDKPTGVAAQWLGNVHADCFISQFALAAHLFGLPRNTTLRGYVWTLLDAQVAAGTKLIPLGQTDGQNLLFRLAGQIQTCLTTSASIALNESGQSQLNEIGQSLPSMAMASAWHQQQYSRLFRS
jgi:urease accessory protein